MVQVIIRWLLTTKVWVASWASSCEIFAVQNCSDISFALKFSVLLLPASFHQCSIHVFILNLLLSGQVEKAWKSSNEAINFSVEHPGASNSKELSPSFLKIIQDLNSFEVYVVHNGCDIHIFTAFIAHALRITHRRCKTCTGT